MSKRKFTKKKFAKTSGLTAAQRKAVQALVAKDADLGYFDTNIPLSSVTQANSPTNLTLVPEGDSDVTRDGQQIQLKSLQWRIQAKANGVSPNAAFVRMVIFRWSESSANPPVAGSVVINTANAINPSNMLNLTTTKGLYQVLHDKIFRIAADFGDPNSRQMFKGFMKLTGKVTYSGAAGINFNRGSIHVRFMSDLASNGPDVRGNFRLRYTK